MKTSKFFLSLIALAACMVACGPKDNPDDPKKDEPIVLPESFERTILLEHFTGEACPNCPNGVKQIEAYLATAPHVVWLSHHKGYKNDQFTCAQSSSAVNKLGVTGAPSVALDRTAFSYLDEDTRKTVSALSYHPYYLTKLKSTPSATTYASLEIKPEFDADSRALKVNVKGLVIDSTKTKLYLTVVVKENGLMGKQEDNNTFAGWEEYIHSNVVRGYLTSVLGDSVLVEKHAYSATLETTLNAKYVAENCQVVAYLTETEGMTVIQAAEVPVVEGTTGGADIKHGGVKTVPVSDIYPEDGNALSDYLNQETITLDNLYADYEQYDGFTLWYIQAYTSSLYYPSGSDRYVPFINLYFFQEQTAKSLPTSGEYYFRNMVDYNAEIGTFWAGYRNDEEQSIDGSEAYLVSLNYLNQGYLVPGAEWLITDGSKATFSASGFTIEGTSFVGNPINIVCTVKGAKAPAFTPSILKKNNPKMMFKSK